MRPRIFIGISEVSMRTQVKRGWDGVPVCGRALAWSRSRRQGSCGDAVSSSRKADPVAIASKKGHAPPSSGDSRRRDVMTVVRSEEHTSELQSLAYLVCRLLLEKKKTSAR